MSVATVCGLVALTAGLGLAISTGVDEDLASAQGGSIAVGCTCHAEEPTPSVTPILLGVPGVYGAPDATGVYTPQTYNLTVSMRGGPEGGKGGFNLHVSAGTLATAEGETGAQITDLGDATHNVASTTRSWNLTWTAPDSADEGVVFRLTVNAVDGDNVPGPSDQWNRLIIGSQGADGASVGADAGDHGLHVETLGVNWLAYWVGIASFVFLGVILILYYFVFRYSETTHATDHRARKDKGKK